MRNFITKKKNILSDTNLILSKLQFILNNEIFSTLDIQLQTNIIKMYKNFKSEVALIAILLSSEDTSFDIDEKFTKFHKTKQDIFSFLNKI